MTLNIIFFLSNEPWTLVILNFDIALKIICLVSFVIKYETTEKDFLTKGLWFTSPRKLA